MPTNPLVLYLESGFVQHPIILRVLRLRSCCNKWRLFSYCRWRKVVVFAYYIDTGPSYRHFIHALRKRLVFVCVLVCHISHRICESSRRAMNLRYVMITVPRIKNYWQTEYCNRNNRRRCMYRRSQKGEQTQNSARKEDRNVARLDEVWRESTHLIFTAIQVGKGELVGGC